MQDWSSYGPIGMKNVLKDRAFRKVIEQMVDKYPNDMILGAKLREYMLFVKNWQEQ